MKALRFFKVEIAASCFMWKTTDATFSDCFFHNVLLFDQHWGKHQFRLVCVKYILDPYKPLRLSVMFQSGVSKMDMLMFFNILNMHKPVFMTARYITGLFFLLGCLVGCTTVSLTGDDKSLKTKSSFAETEYSMGMTPMLFQSASAVLQRGGGRAMIGKPYQIKGKWYYPAQEPDYSKVGLASWYGSEFHGKLTANGEVFDMHHLTAAHPTMPLPSYARVTNLKNGASLVVRINDRGPFAHNRIIDLSRRAAELLGYKNSGLTDVKVEYVGPAPVHGQDDNYLMSSYRPTDGKALTAEMVVHEDTVDHKMQFPSLQKPTLPDYGPQIELKPMLSSAFAEERGDHAASGVFATVLKPADSSASFERNSAQDAYITIGTFKNIVDVKRIAANLGAYGHLKNIQNKDGEGNISYTVSLFDSDNINAALLAAWNFGAVDAFIVRPH